MVRPAQAPAELYHKAHWFAFRTRARAEKKVDRYLEGAGVERFLPLLEEEREWADRTKRIRVPLFPGYVFARATLGELGDVFRAPGLVTVVQLGGYPTPVDEEELSSVRALVEGANRTGRLPSPADYLQKGDFVQVVAGPFRGMRGVLEEIRGATRVAVRLAAIRHALGVEMERRYLRPLRPSRN